MLQTLHETLNLIASRGGASLTSFSHSTYFHHQHLQNPLKASVFGGLENDVINEITSPIPLSTCVARS